MKLPHNVTAPIKENNLKLKAIFLHGKLKGWKASQNGKFLGYYWL